MSVPQKRFRRTRLAGQFVELQKEGIGDMARPHQKSGNRIFAGRALVSLEGGFGAVEYPTMFWLPPTTAAVQLRHAAFTDWRADATLFGEYRFSDTIGVNATLRYTSNISNQLIPDAPPPAMGVFGMGWNRFEAFVGVRWFL